MAPTEILSALTSETISFWAAPSKTSGNQRIGSSPREPEGKCAPVSWTLRVDAPAITCALEAA
jgi:hypothetical protein